MSDLLELEDTRLDTLNIDTENGEHDKFSHYFSKSDIDKNLLFGEPMTALCGKVVKQQVDPKGKTVCQTCKDILDLNWPAEE